VEEEKKSSSIFTHPPGKFGSYKNFGTRAHYIYTVDSTNHATFTEYSLIHPENRWDKLNYEFDIY
jgi:hypothetical protein